MAGLLFIIYAAIFSILILKWKFFNVHGISRTYLLLAFALKLCFGFLLGWIYTDHYTDRKTGDTYRFFDDAQIIYESADEGFDVYLKLLTGICMEEDEVAMKYYYRMTHMERSYSEAFYNDNQTIIRANALTMPFSGGYYHVHIAFWCFASMIGLTAILKVLTRYFPRKKTAMFTAVFLLPTVLFWGSGVLKEPILLLGLGLFFRGIMRFAYGEFKPRNALGFLLGVVLLVFTKGYVLFALIPASAGLLLARAFANRNFWLMFGIPHVALVFLVFLGPVISPTFDFAERMNLKQVAFYNVAEESDSGSLLDLPSIDHSSDLLLNAPNALHVTYLRPWPWEWTNFLYVPAALENLFLFITLGLMLWNFRRPYGLAIPIIAFGVSVVLVLGVLIGEVVPVLGAVVRYKMPALIFLFIVIFGLTDHVMLQRRFPFLRKILKKL
ncbi:MAG: hypothetical protein WBG42_14295 [Cryomorphaceae bacterium]